MKFRRQHKDEELDAEIRSHLDEAMRDRIERGESPDEARVNALREFGNVGLVKEVTRAMWGWATLKQVAQDLRFGLRMLWKNPGFSLVAILTLALGIGTNTAIFSVVNGVLLRPLPFPGSERLVYFEGLNPERGISDGAVSLPDYLDWQSQADAFESIAVFAESGMPLTGDGTEPERVPRAMVTPSFFPTMGVTPLMGRALLKEDEVADDWVAVLSYGLWQRRFGANPNIVGSWITFAGGTRCLVVGVMPRGFDYPAKAQIWTLLYPNPKERRNNRYVKGVGRLKPTATIAGAQSQIGTISARLRQQYPQTNAGWSVQLRGLQDWTTKDVRTSLLLLLGAIGFVLLIACANIANLFLARASARRKEIALRSALGAGRGRIIRQLLTESLLLAALGGAVGLALSLLLTKLLIAISPADVPRLDQVGLDVRVLGFTVGVVGLVGLLFGLAPALQVSKTDLNEALKEGGRGSSEGHGRNRVRALLVVSEIALSVLLLIGAGLLIKSFVLLRDVNPGF